MSVHATKELQAYWKENLVIIIVHLAIWFFVSFFCGIMVVDQLDAYMIGGYAARFLVRQPGLHGYLRHPDLDLCLDDEPAGHQV